MYDIHTCGINERELTVMFDHSVNPFHEQGANANNHLMCRRFFHFGTYGAGVIGDLFRAGDRFLRNRSPGYVPADLFRIRRFVPLVTGDSFRGTNRRDI